MLKELTQIALAGLLVGLPTVPTARPTPTAGFVLPTIGLDAAYPQTVLGRVTLNVDGELNEMAVTDRTDLRLDGRPCLLKDVPDDAVIAALDFSANMRVVYKLWYRSKGK